MDTHKFGWTLLVVFGVLLGTPFYDALGQTPTQVPSTLAPGAIDRQQNQLREPQPVFPGQPLTLKTERSGASAGAQSMSFTLRSLSVRGAHALSSQELVAPYAGLVGQVTNVARLYAMADEMTVRYRKAGYVLSSVLVPEQTIESGEVVLQAVEGYVARVSFEGQTGRRPSLLEHMQAKVVAEHPLTTRTLEGFLLLLNDLPGVTAQGVLQPSNAAPGAADLVVRMQSIKVDGTVAVNNRGSSLQGPVQVQAGLSANSLFGTFDNTSLQYLQAGRASELRYYYLSHRETLTAYGLAIDGNFSHSRSNTEFGEALAGANLQTNNTQGRIDLSAPLYRSRVSDLYAHLALTYSDGKTDAPGLPLNHDIIAAVRLGINADLRDRAAGVNTLALEFGQGLNAMGASRYGDPYASRPDGHPDFHKLTLDLARLQSLGGPFSLLLAVNGQFAFDKLLIAEEFAYGGEYFGRAYDASELVGDSGFDIKSELRYTLGLPYGIDLTLYGFGEDGFVWRRITTDISTPREDHAVSVGGGARYNLTRWLSGYVEYAKPVHHVIQVLGDERSRVFAGLQFNFNF